MKIRTDFVTNSSSSSFILAFNDEASIVEELLKDNTCGQFERLLEDITASRHVKTKEEVLEYFRDDIYYPVKWEIEEKLEREKNLSWRDISDWINKNKEKFNKMVQKEIDKQVSELEEKLKNKNYIVMVEYSDDCDSEMEHYIAPNLNCCIERISHH